MQSPRSSSPASRVAGCVLAALSLLVGFALGAGKGAGLFASFGTALAASFSWASWLIPLWLAVILHSGGTVLVGLNALRLLRR